MKKDERIRAAREQADLTQVKLAELTGVTRGAVAQWESPKHGPPGRENAQKIAEYTGVSLEWLLTGKGQMLPHSEGFSEEQNAFIMPPPTNERSPDIPVYGQAVGGVDGQFEMNGNTLFTVPAPPLMQNIKQAYAVMVSGDSMSPRYEDGEIAFIDPWKRPRPGDYVIAQIKDNEIDAPLAFIKRLVRYNSNELILSQLNPVKELKFTGDSVVSVHYIRLAGECP